MSDLTTLQDLTTPINTLSNGCLLTYDSSITACNITTMNYPLNNLYNSTGTGTHYYDSSGWVSTPTNPLQKLKYSADFILSDVKKRYLLEDNIKEIKKNKMSFNCKYEGNRIQPYEFIMSLIEKKEKISVKIKVSDILTVCYTNLQFTKIENNLIFNSECDFSVLKVKFKCDKILYENHKLSEKELRTDKLKKILEDNE